MFGFGGQTQAAMNAANTASSTGAGYGADASGINAQLMPFLTRELNNPQGYTQNQTTDMLGAAEGGAGGATAGLTTEANLASARNRNSGGFSGALDNAAMQKDKALAGTSEGIAANSANLAQQHQQEAASGLGSMYGEDQNAQLKAMGLVAPDIHAATEASAGPWSALSSIIGDAGGVAKLAGGFGIPGFSGFKPGGN